MKKSTLFWFELLIIISLGLVSGCDYRENIRERWLCSVYIDGTGFSKILLDKYPPQHDFLQMHNNYYAKLLIARNSLLRSDNYYYSGQTPFVIVSAQPFTGITTVTNGYLSYLTSRKNIYSFAYNTLADLDSTNYFLGVPYVDLNGNIVTMAGFINQDDVTGNVIVFFNKNNSTHNIIAAPQGVNKVLYIQNLGKLLCFCNEAVYTMNLNGTGYYELYRFETGNPGQWHSRYAYPLDNGSKFLVLKDNFEMVVVSTADLSQQVIGPVTPFYDDLYGGLSFNIEVSRDSNFILYTLDGNIYRYDLLTNTNTLIISPKLGSNQFQNINSVCTSWDGTRIYFIAQFDYEIEKSKTAITEDKFSTQSEAN